MKWSWLLGLVSGCCWEEEQMGKGLADWIYLKEGLKCIPVYHLWLLPA